MSRALVVAVVLLGAARANAEPPPKADARALDDAKKEAKIHFKQGAAYYAAGAYQEAVAEYEAAYALLPLSDFLFNLGQAYRMRGDRKKALDHYQRYVSAQPAGVGADEARGFISSLRRELDEERLKEEQAVAKRKADAEAAEKARAEAAAATAAASASAPAPVEHKPVYKKWWLWAIVGGVVVAGVAVGLGVGLTVGKKSGDSFNPTIEDLGPNAGMALSF